MIGRLIGTHMFAVQPRVERTLDLALSLGRRTGVSKRILAIARRQVQAMLRHQREQKGIDTRLELPW
jgi:hypothetical protein